MDVLLPILDWVLPVVAGILTLVLIAVSKKYIGKLGIERSDKVDDMIERYVTMGIAAAEKSADVVLKAQQGKLTGGSKKALAVKVVLAELEQSGIKGVAEELISNRIEAALGGADVEKSTGEDSTIV